MTPIERLGSVNNVQTVETYNDPADNAIKNLEEAVTSVSDKIDETSSKEIINSHNSSSKGVTLRKKINQAVENLKGKILSWKDSLKNFFDKSPTIGDLCKTLNIEFKDFTGFPFAIQDMILCAELSDCGKNLSTKQKIGYIENLNGELRKFLNTSTSDNAKSREAANFLLTQNENTLKGLKIELAAEQKAVYNALKVKGDFTNKNFAEYVSNNFGGKVIGENREPLNLSFNGKPVKVNVMYTPQKLMSGYTNNDTMKHCSSALRGKTNHATNLFKQEININGETIKFLRSGCTRDKTDAGREILANALALNKSENEIINAAKEGKVIPLKFANTQLMPTSFLGDQDLPIQQIDVFKELFAESQKNGFIKVNYQGTEVLVKLEEPVLFNFGTNLQYFMLPNYKSKNYSNNIQEFQKLFGEGFPKIDKDKIGGEVGKFLKSLSDQGTDINKRQRILNLSKQIIEIYGKAKKETEGINQNPYALPCRTIALMNLLGYASSYNCKSGKDRTGVASIEITNLAAQLISTNATQDPWKTSDEEQKNLQEIYASGDAINIANINMGGIQKNLKIKESSLFWNPLENRFGISLSQSFDENMAMLGKNNKLAEIS